MGLTTRVKDLENKVTQIQKKIRKKVVKRQLKLSEKLLIHDRAKNLEEQWHGLYQKIANQPVSSHPVSDAFLNMGKVTNKALDEVSQIVVYLVKLVDAALGVTP